MTSTTTASSFNRKQVLVAFYAAAVAFLTYASVYAYRKPFTVSTFEGVSFRGISYQTLLIISQVIGYMLSKFFGIKFIAELKRLGRWKTSAALIGIAWLSLFLFALVPPPYGVFCFLVNGFMLGFMWGIVFSYVEGRRATDFIGSVMAVSFIFAGGFTRSVAVWLHHTWAVNEYWLPFVTGLLFAFPLALFIYLLEKIPPPDTQDIQERTERHAMNAAERKAFIKMFTAGLVVVVLTYLFLTVMRDVRDNYMANMWQELGYGNDYKIFAGTETITSVVVLAVMSLLVLIRRNILAFRIIHFVIVVGFIIAGIASLLFVKGWLPGHWWMQLTGMGLYMAYIPFNCIFFERMIAAFRIKGNVGFLIYVADSFGYLGSVLVMLGKEFLSVQLKWSFFYSNAVIWLSIAGLLGTILSFFYFNKKYSQKPSYPWTLVQPSSSVPE